MMRRFLTVSTVALLSSLGMINEVHAGLFNQPQPLATLPKHNLTLAQADIPANPILAKTATQSSTTDIPPLPTFAQSPDTSTSSDTPPLPTFAKTTETPASSDIPPNPTFANSPENPTTTNPENNGLNTGSKPSEQDASPQIVNQSVPQPALVPPPADPILNPTIKAKEIKLLPEPSVTTHPANKAKRLPAPKHLHQKHHHHHTHKAIAPEHKPMLPFKGIAADGNIHVIVEPGNSRSVQVLNTNHPASKLVFADVSRGVLILHDISRENLDEQAPQFIKVKVVTPSLGSIKLRDHSCLSAKNLAYNIMDIDTATTGFLKIRGNVCLHHILQHGRGPINIEWTNSDHIKIISTGPGLVHIAGITDILNIRAKDHANIDAKFLRANSGLIQTDENATVAVNVIDALSGFATGISNIFYYKTPRHLTRHTYDLGNVIQMNYWN